MEIMGLSTNLNWFSRRISGPSTVWHPSQPRFSPLHCMAQLNRPPWVKQGFRYLAQLADVLTYMQSKYLTYSTWIFCVYHPPGNQMGTRYISATFSLWCFSLTGSNLPMASQKIHRVFCIFQEKFVDLPNSLHYLAKNNPLHDFIWISFWIS